jgi:hypothetical protein
LNEAYIPSVAECQTRLRHGLPIQTLRTPLQRFYVAHASDLLQDIQKKVYSAVFAPMLLDFGFLFSGLHKKSQETLHAAYTSEGNCFAKSVRNNLLSGPVLVDTTRSAIGTLSASLSSGLLKDREELYELVRHQLTVSLTTAIYGPENPYKDHTVEASWWYAILVPSWRGYSRANTRKVPLSRASVICCTAPFRP